jgi:hypothetical protein
MINNVDLNEMIKVAVTCKTATLVIPPTIISKYFLRASPSSVVVKL